MPSNIFKVDKQVCCLLCVLLWPVLKPLFAFQLVFYGAYHSNKTNVLIHIVCVPLIVW